LHAYFLLDIFSAQLAELVKSAVTVVALGQTFKLPKLVHLCLKLTFKRKYVLVALDLRVLGALQLGLQRFDVQLDSLEIVVQLVVLPGHCARNLA
jgi:hypothetical protein